MSRAEAGVAPFKRMDGEPVFDAPWQASVLAIADTLIARGVVPPRIWSEALGAALKAAESRGEPDNAETYYRAALTALERLAETHGGVTAASVEDRRNAWEAAYRATPHGEPVLLANARRGNAPDP